MTRVAILQPNYIPWRGYFDMISQVDIFVFLDDVQYTKQDWRNRNRICTRNGDPVWLTVPVRVQFLEQQIRDVPINNDIPWVRKHLAALQSNYGKAPFFESHFEQLRDIYLERHELISDLDITLARQVCTWLGITTKFYRSSELAIAGSKDSKLIQIIKTLGGTSYLSGPAAKAYIQPTLWEQAGIGLEFISYPDYPIYPQINPGFEPHVSVLDLLFMTGPDAPRHIWPNRAPLRIQH